MHKFKVGQLLEVIPAAHTTMQPGPCTVIATLPFEGNRHRYRIKSMNEVTERVVNEFDLRTGLDGVEGVRAKPSIPLSNWRKDREPKRRGIWEKPVWIRRRGVTYQMTSAAQAGSMLLDADWPDTKLSLAARKACLTALDNGDPEKAREAFAAAVEERQSQHR